MMKLVAFLSLLLLSCSTTSPVSSVTKSVTVEVAQYLCQGDIGASANQIDKSLGPSVGTVLVNCGGGNIATTISIGKNHTLKFGPGVYTSSTPGPVILLDTGSTVEGTDWSTILKPSSADVEGSRVISAVRFDDVNDVTVRNLAIDGGGLQDPAGARGVIQLNNAHHATVSGVYMHDFKVIGVVVGASSYMGGHAEDVWVSNNLFDRVTPNVPIAVVNGRSVHVTGNTCRNNMNCIDFEPNTPEDLLQSFEVSGNVVDAAGSGYYGFGVLVQGAWKEHVGPGVISGNVFNGSNLASQPGVACSTCSNDMVNAIFVEGQDITVVGNQIRWSLQHGIYVRGRRHKIFGNNITGAAVGIRLEDATYVDVTNNTLMPLRDPYIAGMAGIIRENGSSNNNLIGWNHLGCDYPDPYFPGGIVEMGAIYTVGAKTQIVGNVIDACP